MLFCHRPNLFRPFDFSMGHNFGDIRHDIKESIGVTCLRVNPWNFIRILNRQHCSLHYQTPDQGWFATIGLVTPNFEISPFRIQSLWFRVTPSPFDWFTLPLLQKSLFWVIFICFDLFHPPFFSSASEPLCAFALYPGVFKAIFVLLPIPRTTTQRGHFNNPRNGSDFPLSSFIWTQSPSSRSDCPQRRMYTMFWQSGTHPLPLSSHSFYFASAVPFLDSPFLLFGWCWCSGDVGWWVWRWCLSYLL